MNSTPKLDSYGFPGELNVKEINKKMEIALIPATNLLSFLECWRIHGTGKGLDLILYVIFSLIGVLRTSSGHIKESVWIKMAISLKLTVGSQQYTHHWNSLFK